MILAAGQIYIITSGEYSDYGIRLTLRPSIDVDLTDTIELIKQHDSYSEKLQWQDQVEALEKYLTNHPDIKTEVCKEINIGAYGDLK